MCSPEHRDGGELKQQWVKTTIKQYSNPDLETLVVLNNRNRTTTNGKQLKSCEKQRYVCSYTNKTHLRIISIKLNITLLWFLLSIQKNPTNLELFETEQQIRPTIQQRNTHTQIISLREDIPLLESSSSRHPNLHLHHTHRCKDKRPLKWNQSSRSEECAAATNSPKSPKQAGPCVTLDFPSPHEQSSR